MTRVYSKQTDSFTEEVSRRTVRSAVNVCVTLSLVSENGKLTTAGRKAINPTKFDEVVARQIREFLLDHNVRLSDLNGLIQRSFRADPPVLPTANVLWEHCGGDVGKGSFSSMLTLLANCRSAVSSQKKVYLSVLDTDK